MRTRTETKIPGYVASGELKDMRDEYDKLLAEDPHLITYTWEPSLRKAGA